jgi:hypothetical protein
MKTFITIIATFVLLQSASAQFKSAGLLAGAGVTIVDVSKVLEPYELSDWNTYSMMFKGFAEYSIADDQAIGLEAGTNRLYYWEYPALPYSWYNWRTEWTTNVVAYFLKDFGSRFYLQSGVGLHIFHNGTAAGLMAGGGAQFYLSEQFVIPLFLRVEPIFGAETPVAINIGTGLKYNFQK